MQLSDPCGTSTIVQATYSVVSNIITRAAGPHNSTSNTELTSANTKPSSLSVGNYKQRQVCDIIFVSAPFSQYIPPTVYSKAVECYLWQGPSGNPLSYLWGDQ